MLKFTWYPVFEVIICNTRNDECEFRQLPFSAVIGLNATCHCYFLCCFCFVLFLFFSVYASAYSNSTKHGARNSLACEHTHSLTPHFALTYAFLNLLIYSQLPGTSSLGFGLSNLPFAIVKCLASSSGKASERSLSAKTAMLAKKVLFLSFSFIKFLDFMTVSSFHILAHLCLGSILNHICQLRLG